MTCFSFRLEINYTLRKNFGPKQDIQNNTFT